MLEGAWYRAVFEAMNFCRTVVLLESFTNCPLTNEVSDCGIIWKILDVGKHIQEYLIKYVNLLAYSWAALAEGYIDRVPSFYY